MAEGKSKKQNKKGQTLSLHDFLATPAEKSDWADEESGDLGPPPGGADAPSSTSRADAEDWRHGRVEETQGEEGRSYQREERRREPREPRPEVPIPDQPPYCAYVSQLSWEVTDDDLRHEIFREFKLLSASVVKDRETGRSRGFAFVELESRRDLEEALMSLNDLEIRGRRIRVAVKEQTEKDRERYQAGAGRSGFGGRGFGARREGEGGYEHRGPRETREPEGPQKEFSRDLMGAGLSELRSKAPERAPRGPRPEREGGADFERREPRGPPREREPDTRDWSRNTMGTAEAPAARPRSNPFGDARPRDEEAAQKHAHDEAARVRQERQRGQEPPKPSVADATGNWRSQMGQSLPAKPAPPP